LLVVIGLLMIIIFWQLFAADGYLITEMPINFEISSGNIIGFDASSTSLTFGKISPGATSMKQVIVTNTRDKDVIVILKVEGNLSQYISFEQNKIPLKPFEQKGIMIFATAPLNYEEGMYTGYLKVYSIKK